MANLSTWSTTAASNNSSPPDGFPEGMAFSGVNDGMREVMASVRRFYEDMEWRVWGHTTTYASSTSFTIASTDVTAIYYAGRRIRAVGSSTGTIYGTVSSSSFSTNTTVNVTWDSGSLSNETLTISVGINGKAIRTTDISGIGTMASQNASAVAITGGTITGATTINMVSTDAGASGGPDFNLYRNSASPAASDVIGGVVLQGNDSALNPHNYAAITATITDATNGSEDGYLSVNTSVAGTTADRFRVGAGLYSAGAADPGVGKINCTGYQISGTDIVATQAQVEATTALDCFLTPARAGFHPGVAKAWVHFNGTGTVAINASYNVSSITDNGTGDYTVNFAVSFSSSNYGFAISGGEGIIPASSPVWVHVGSTAPTSNSFRISCTKSAVGAFDTQYVAATFYGDQ